MPAVELFIMTPERKKYLWIVLSLCFAVFMGRLDTYIVNISLPTISKQFNVATSQVSQILLYFFLFTTSTMMIFGKLSDRPGTLKKIFVWGYIIFTAASFMCGTSPNITALVLSRCVQGIGAAMLAVSVFALTSKLLPEEHTGWAFGLISTAAGLGVAVGAPVGGIITNYFSWHWVFLINVPVGIAAVIIAMKVIPDVKSAGEEKKANPKFDIAGAIISFFAVWIILYALNAGQEKGWASPVIISCFAGFLVLLFLFIFLESKHCDPLLDIKFFKDKNLTYAVVSACLVYMFLSGNNFIMPFYLQLLKGLTPAAVGVVLMSFSLVYVLIAPGAGKMADKIHPRILCSFALFFCMLSCAFFYFTLHLNGIICAVLLLVFFGVSLAFFMSPNNKLIMSLAPQEEKGTASGVYNTFTNLSLAFGVCAFETAFSQVLPSSNTSIVSGNIPADILIKGFRHAYLLAIIIFLVSFIFSVIKVNPQKK